MSFTETYYREHCFKGKTLNEQCFSNIEFDGCTFKHCDFSNSQFTNCKFTDCQFISCNLNLVQFKFSRFVETVFEQTKLTGINWTSANWSTLKLASPIKFYQCQLNHGSFFGLYLAETEIIDCQAKEVDFREADLHESLLTNTDFEGSLFMHTNLIKADLSEASHYHIDPLQNTLKQAKFTLPDALVLLEALDIIVD